MAPATIKTPLIVIFVLALFAPPLAAPAQADAGPKLPDRALYISPGLVLGGSSTLDVGTGFMLGGELSVFYWLHPRIKFVPNYTGLVVDALFDWKRDAMRMMIGPEIGWAPIGIDGGYLLDRTGGVTRHGGAVRLFLSMGIAAIFVRYGNIKGAPDFVDWGMMIKIPLSAWQKRHYRRRPVPRRPPASAPSLNDGAQKK